jgi:Siphovirus Gp157
MSVNLVQTIAEHAALQAELQAKFADIDDETLRDTLEGLSSLPEALAAVVRGYLEDLSLAAALGMRIGEMQERLARFETRAERKRALVTQVMERAELRKLAEPDFTVSLRAVPPGLIVSDEGLIPADYWKPQPLKLDRKGLLAGLTAGAAIPGVSLGNGGTTIAVRTS